MIFSTSFNEFNKYYDGNESFAAMKKVGYGACDLGLGLRKKLLEPTDPARVEFLRFLPALAKKHGIKIGQTHGAFFFETDCYDKEYIAEHIRLKKEEIRVTAQLDCKYMVVHPLFFTGWSPNTEPTRARGENIRILQELCSYAKDYGVLLALENMPGNPNHNFACSTAEDLAAHIAGVNSSNLCACLDFGHANMSVKNKISEKETSLSDYVRILGEQIKCIHVHDNTGAGDLHSLPLSPHFGGIEWEGVIGALRDIGYRGTFNAEVDFCVRYPKELFLDCEKLQLAILKEIAKPFLENK